MAVDPEKSGVEATEDSEERIDQEVAEIVRNFREAARLKSELTHEPGRVARAARSKERVVIAAYLQKAITMRETLERVSGIDPQLLKDRITEEMFRQQDPEPTLDESEQG